MNADELIALLTKQAFTVPWSNSHSKDKGRSTLKEQAREAWENPGQTLGTAAMTAGVHRGAEAGLTGLARSTNLGRRFTRNYYGNLAVDGLDTGLNGTKPAMGAWRRIFGGVSPALTGLTDYELWMAIGKDTRDKLATQYGSAADVPASAIAEARKRMAGLTAAEINEFTSTRPVLQARTYKSPLLYNLAHGLTTKEKSPLAGYLLGLGREFDSSSQHTGVGKLMIDTLGGYATHGLPGAVGMAVTGIPNALIMEAANSGKMNAVTNVKSKLVAAGMGAPGQQRGRILQSLLAVAEPASSELVSFGRDISNVPRNPTDPAEAAVSRYLHNVGDEMKHKSEKSVGKSLAVDRTAVTPEEVRSQEAQQSHDAKMRRYDEIRKAREEARRVAMDPDHARYRAMLHEIDPSLAKRPSTISRLASTAAKVR